MNIAVIGAMGTGKDFIGEYLIKRYGFTRYAFADHVKGVAQKWFPEMYGVEGEKPRALLQAVGTKFREIDTDVWIKSTLRDIDTKQEFNNKYSYKPENVIITDCRMPNEYKALKERGFKFIRIDVDEETRLQRLRNRGDSFVEKDLQHDSEQHYSSFECEYYIFNQGSAELAYEQVDRVMDELMSDK